MIFLLQAHSRMLARRAPKPATRVDSLAQCNHAVNLILPPFLYCLGLPLLYRQALYSLKLYSLQRSCSCKLSCMLPERRILGCGGTRVLVLCQKYRAWRGASVKPKHEHVVVAGESRVGPGFGDG